MLRVREAIVVEGKYDKNTLSQIVDAPIFQTDGFSIFHDTEKLALLRAVAAKRGLIVLTDSDGAGLVIRNFLKGAIPPSQLRHAYIPDVFGKERRKSAPGKEGKLGVEGMHSDVLLAALRRCGATVAEEATTAPAQSITKADLAQWGLSGGKNSAEKRRALQKELGFPENMSANALLQALNLLYEREELAKILEKYHD